MKNQIDSQYVSVIGAGTYPYKISAQNGATANYTSTICILCSVTNDSRFNNGFTLDYIVLDCSQLLDPRNEKGSLRFEFYYDERGEGELFDIRSFF